VRLRQQFEKQFGPEYATFLAWMGALRPPMSQQYPDFQEQRALWYELVDSQILSLIRDRKLEEARELLKEISGIVALPDAE
jgi:precorrin-2 dehydrogenase/sirohydrochlorin ferrochelatase